ncbi:restriction endonuclease subunit S [Aliarcobacter butzleri]|uniref:Restriction endonuclease subunit S n=1 Tax=Aliarcobacter butzleri TaxID=28197 RepID=A0AAW7PYK1_9BACT|nr:restriction endonuclease subunit S [Aliarcobacter butzleri]MCG3668135.1 restriction endonuclease subunit S [Aliarcobacter butzleri]MDN5071072.1 restriction endonuclease subunit S [Aliarcobacter butzleri]
MSSWRECKLGDIAEIIGGGTPSTSNNEFWNGNIPWLTPRDLTGYSKVYISHGERFITESGLKNSSAKLMPKGTVLLTSRAPIGYVVIAENGICTNQGFKSLVPNFEILNSEFLYYWLKSNTDYLQQLGTGTTFAEISGSVVKNIDISLPSLEEQKAIAEVLSSLDDKIDLLHRQNQTLESLAQTLFRQWFIEEAKEEWEVGILDDILSVKGGTTPSTANSDFWDGNISWTTPRDLSSNIGVYLFKTERKITEEGLKKISSGLLPIGTVLLSSRAPVGYLAITDIPLSINQGYIAILDDKGFSKYFIYLWLKENMEYIISNANGSTFLEISKSVFKSLEIVMPPKELRLKFDNEIVSTLEKIKINSKQIHTLENLRDTLLSKLLSGEVRVK